MEVTDVGVANPDLPLLSDRGPQGVTCQIRGYITSPVNSRSIPGSPCSGTWLKNLDNKGQMNDIPYTTGSEVSSQCLKFAWQPASSPCRLTEAHWSKHLCKTTQMLWWKQSLVWKKSRLNVLSRRGSRGGGVVLDKNLFDLASCLQRHSDVWLIYYLPMITPEVHYSWTIMSRSSSDLFKSDYLFKFTNILKTISIYLEKKCFTIQCQNKRLLFYFFSFWLFAFHNTKMEFFVNMFNCKCCKFPLPLVWTSSKLCKTSSRQQKKTLF